MSQWLDQKRKFYRDICKWTPENLVELKRMLANPWGAEDFRLERWWKKFHEIPESIILGGRLVNHYMQGADPEFQLVRREEEGDEEDNGLRHAELFGLKAGRAFGADNNGRLVEVRPKPSRNQLEVLGSIHDTLRWMYILLPTVRDLSWVCGAFLNGDGLGGHVHVARKREKLQEKEVQALDGIARLIEELRLFNKSQLDRRRQGDRFGQIYGVPGDIRKQKYGYEYRTYPSWLDSPWMAYLHLVLTKLAIFDPELVNTATGNAKQHIKSILRYYRGTDDDAELAVWAMERMGLPINQGGDFKGRWGLGGYGKERIEGVFVPDSIPASKGTLEELWGYFAEGKGIKTGQLLLPAWEPNV